jgi:hypothetical protein
MAGEVRAQIAQGCLPNLATLSNPRLVDLFDLLYARFAEGMVSEYPHYAPPTSGVPPPADSGIGNFQEVDGKEAKKVKPGATRDEQYRASTTGASEYGGVVFGNRVSGGSLNLVRAVFRSEGSNAWIDVIHLGADGREFTSVFDGFTATELWSAYHVLRPTADMKAKQGARDNSVGLISCRPNEMTVGRFAIHPAIANTPLARAAMILDMTPLDVFPQLDPIRPRLLGVQWVDAEAVLLARDGRLEVRAGDGLPGLVRLRVWGPPNGNPPWRVAAEEEKRKAEGEGADPIDPVKLALAEIDRRIEARLFNPPGGRPPDYVTRQAYASAYPEASLKVWTELSENLPIPTGKVVRLAYGLLPHLPQVDRFARLLAVLNWLADEGKLPPLPATVKPVRIPVTPVTSSEEVAALLHVETPLQLPEIHKPDPGNSRRMGSRRSGWKADWIPSVDRARHQGGRQTTPGIAGVDPACLPSRGHSYRAGRAIGPRYGCDW